MTEAECQEYCNYIEHGENEKAIAFIETHPNKTRWFHIAVINGCIPVLEYLLNLKTPTYGEIYHDAVCFDQFAVAKLLLSYKIPIDAGNWCGATALDYALDYDCLVFARFFLENGARKPRWHLRITQYQEFCVLLKEKCMVVLFAKNGRKDTNRIIAKVMWGMRLYL